jgi:hypothetical protein
MEAKDYAVAFSKKLYELGVAKQITNRITEPFQNITLVISGTEWENFYALRAEENAQPEFRMLAYKMLELHNDNLKNVNVVTPCDNIELLYDILTNKVTDYMEEKYWHLPFSDKHTSEMNIKDKLKVSVARCARTFYLNQDGDILPEKDFKLFDRLVTGNHYSPLEHCALCVPAAITYSLRSNFGLGWLQYRKFFNNENKTDSRLLKFSC